MNKKVYLKGLVIKMISAAGSGHYASSLSALEIMYPLFYKEKISPDQFILSKGHAVPALYAILYDLGYLADLSNFRQYYGLPGHPELGIDGITCSSGSLGMGISKAVGLARMNPDKIYHVLVGDGELQEGQNWEALLYLIGNQIDNVIVHVDCNGQQYSGRVGHGIAFLDLLYGDEHHIIRQVRLHLTRWNRDNKYLTLPQMPEYTKLVSDYGKYLYNLMLKNDKIIVLDADLVDDFGLRIIADKFPDRFIECGISEQHMVSMANGIALSGYYPVCHTFGAFYRHAIDQMYNNYRDGLNIVYTAGLVGKPPMNIGASHEAIVGKDLLSWLPNILITNDIEDLRYIGSKSIYLELEI